MTIRDHPLRNVNFGISVSATDSLVADNLVENSEPALSRDPARDRLFRRNLRGLDHRKQRRYYRPLARHHAAGARNCLVIDNTVLDENNATPGPPWIQIGNHKNGTPPVDCVVRNNLAATFNSAAGVRQENNLKIMNPTALFVDPAHFDLHLRPGAAAIDAGSSLDAPALDRDRIPRPQGNGLDIGAYEWHSADVQPVPADDSGSR